MVNRMAGFFDPGVPDDQLKDRPIGRVLIKIGLLTREQLHKALDIQKSRKERGTPQPLGEILVALHVMTPKVRDLALLLQIGQAPPDWRTTLTDP